MATATPATPVLPAAPWTAGRVVALVLGVLLLGTAGTTARLEVTPADADDELFVGVARSADAGRAGRDRAGVHPLTW